MTNIYRADFPNAPAYFSNVDLKAAFYRKYSGLASGSLSDHMHAFFMRETGLGPGLGMGTYLKAFLAQTSAKSFKEWESGQYVETVRTNLASSPAGTTFDLWPGKARWASRWFSNGTGGVSRPGGGLDGPEVSPGSKVNTYIRKTWTAPGQVGDTGFDHTGPSASTAGVGTTALPINPGKTYAVSAYMRPILTTSETRSFFTRAVYRNLSGERIVGPSWGGGQTLALSGDWVRPFLVVTAPSDAVTLSMSTDVSGTGTWLTTETLDGTALLIEEADSALGYFDGSFPSTFHKRHAWLGDPHDSQSTQTIRTWVK